MLSLPSLFFLFIPLFPFATICRTTQKERDAAQNNLGRVIADYRKRFSSFAPSSQESYSHEISKVVQTLLPAWLQYRNTFVPLKKKEKEASAS